MKRLLLDQGLPRSTGVLLAETGWDVIHVSEIGMSRADDGDILKRARSDKRVCVTLDADFHALLATSRLAEYRGCARRRRHGDHNGTLDPHSPTSDRQEMIRYRIGPDD